MPPPASDKNELFAQYQILEDLGDLPSYSLYKVKSPSGSFKLWKKIDLQFNSAANETRLLPVLEKIHHPYLNAVTNSFMFPDKGLLFVESDFPAKTLRHRLEECRSQGGQGGIPVGELFSYISQVAEGLDFLNTPQHQYQGKKIAIYHRAISPDSLHLFEDKGKIICKLGDFGLAKPVLDTSQAVRHSLGLTNYDYAPPEFDEGLTASTSDQYSLATTYYVLRTGKFPFSGSLLAKMQAQLTGATDLSAVDAAERPPIARALSKDPAARFRTCREFVQHLQAALGGAAHAPINAQRVLAKSSSASGKSGGILSGSSLSRAGSLAKSSSRAGTPETPAPVISSAKTPVAGEGWSISSGITALGKAKEPTRPAEKKVELVAGKSVSTAPPVAEQKLGTAQVSPAKPAETKTETNVKVDAKPVVLETENWTPGKVTSARTSKVEALRDPPTPPATPAPRAEPLSSKALETLELIKKRQAQSASQAGAEKAAPGSNIPQQSFLGSSALPNPSAAPASHFPDLPASVATKQRPPTPPLDTDFPASALPATIKRSAVQKKNSSKKSSLQVPIPDLQKQPTPSAQEGQSISLITVIMVGLAAFFVFLIILVFFFK